MNDIFLYGKEGPYHNYVAALACFGSRTVVSRQLPCAEDYGGLLLPGGGDIFGKLDEDESAVISAFVAAGKPILGICRGMQALNVWFGGTLYDFIPGHQTPEGDLIHPTRADGLVARLVGGHPMVNSNHHQAVHQLGQELQAVQWSDDGTIEALVHKTLPILGVQWHPERQSCVQRRTDAADAAPVFAHFLAQCR
ncbi:MAG: gamma-glutamyl-gamma-aminobutyrate hydrolase family protein [Oscillospiraceae bacterium]|nr:gamma-glutamyl-gamma-aminobutyrate hydrolase family protein [Oscillospiraceae bacterium]